MILLQQGTGMELLWASENIIIFEAAILILIGLRQLYLSIKVYSSIQDLKKIFKHGFFIKNRFIDKKQLFTIINENDHITDDNIGEESKIDIPGDEIIKLSLVETKGTSPIIERIKKGINTYLINNYGAAVNFSIIKDIMDREVDIKDEEISQSVTVPLYLGLAATMFGIIVGLLSMPSINTEGNNFSDGINSLIEGVQWAMSTSLLGLACTTLLSSRFYKKAKRESLKAKNTQLSYLQAKLLPELIKAEDTGVSGLKASLDRFARVATNISDNVLTASNQTGENLVLQQEVIDKIENMEVLKVSKWNLELFDKLDNNMEALNKFSFYLAQMEEISSNLLEFSQRTSNIDQIIHHIDSTLTKSEKLARFLSVHFDKIDSSGNAALKAVGLAENQFEEAIKILRERTDKTISQLAASSGEHEKKLEEIYKTINTNLNQITKEYIQTFSEAYSGAVPKFNQLENLKLLPEFKSDSNILGQELISRVDELNSSIKSLEEDLKNTVTKSYQTKLDIVGRSTEKEPTFSPSKKEKKSVAYNAEPEKKPLGIGTIIKNLFKNAKSDK